MSDDPNDLEEQSSGYLRADNFRFLSSRETKSLALQVVSGGQSLIIEFQGQQITGLLVGLTEHLRENPDLIDGPDPLKH